MACVILPHFLLFGDRDKNFIDILYHILCGFFHIAQCINNTLISTFVIFKQPSFKLVPVKLKEELAWEKYKCCTGIITVSTEKVYRIVDFWHPNTYWNCNCWYGRTLILKDRLQTGHFTNNLKCFKGRMISLYLK